MPGAIERLQAKRATGSGRCTALEQELAPLPRRGTGRCRGAVDRRPARAGRVVDGDANGLKSLASAIVSRPGFIVVLVSSARPALVVAARSQDGSVSANHVVKALTATFGGRGGGKPELAQAGGLDGNAGTRSWRQRAAGLACRGGS